MPDAAAVDSGYPWARARLSELCSLIKDGTHGSHPRQNAGIPLLSAKNITSRGEVVIDDTDSRISEREYQLIHGSYELLPGDLLLTIVGTLGRRALVQSGPKFAIQRSVAVLRPDRTALDERFFFHLAATASFEAELVRRSNATAQAGVYLNELARIEVELPPLPEQRRIARVLDTVDAAIRQTEAVIAKLKQVKAGLLHDLLTRGLDENGELRDPVRHPEQFKDSPLGRLPKEWEVREVRDVCRLGRGRVISQGYLQEHPGPYPVFSSQSHGEGVFGHIDTFDFEGEYVTWTTDGANAGTVFYRSGKFNCTNVCGTLQSSEGLAMKYLAYALSRRTKSYVSYIGNPKLMNNIMARIPVEVPPQPEQEAIIRRIEVVDKRTAKEESSLTKLSQLKQGLMQDLLTGRVRVPEEAVEGVTA